MGIFSSIYYYKKCSQQIQDWFLVYTHVVLSSIFAVLHQTNCYVYLQVIFECFLGQAAFHYGCHCTALRGLRTVRSLSSDYATLLSSCPGWDTKLLLVIYIIVKHLVLKYFIIFHLSTWAARYKGHITQPEHFPGQPTEIVSHWLLMLCNYKFQMSLELNIFISQRPNVSLLYWNIQLSISTCTLMISVPTKYFNDKVFC